MYDVPGLADQINSTLVQKWNDMIQSHYELLQPSYGTRFFSLDPQSLSSSAQVTISWFADPAEPKFCIGPEVAQQLSDWGVRGRQELHNEYCEYRIIEKPDSSGRMRPKRVQVTTELREYWICIAMHDPNKLREMTEAVIGFEPSWEDLYGVNDPLSLSVEHRKIEFCKLMAGHGNDRQLEEAGVPSQPTGKINTVNALFMTHPINGLDDLLYIVMFGAKPYAALEGNRIQQATREQIFLEFGVQQLACRHADPAAAMGAYGAAFKGKPIAFGNPLGMYILSFTRDIFLLEDQPIPDNWVRWSRGQPKIEEKPSMWQHLEFGPADDEPWFLDDIRIAYGASREPLVGGFQLLQNMEVGPLIDVGAGTTVEDQEYVILNTTDEPIQCHEARVCRHIQNLKAEYDRAHPLTRIAPRTMGYRV
jgi:hypothetical protein